MATLSISSPKVLEGKPGSTTVLRFVVSLSAPAAQLVTVNYATTDSAKAKLVASAGASATEEGVDYIALSEGLLSFAIGQTEAYIDVTIVGDREKEGDEAFDVVLTTPVGASFGKSTVESLTGSGTITDDEPTITIGTAKIDESATGGMLRFLVSLSAAAPQTVTLNYATADNGKTPASGGEANAEGSDYLAVAEGTLTIPVGKKQGYIEIPVYNDALDEGDETFDLILTNPLGASFSKGESITGVGTIVDDENAKGGTGTLSVSTTSVYEGEALYFTVSLSAPTANTVTVSYAASATKTKDKTGAASLGSDFEKTAGTLTFQPGQTAKIVSIETNDDSLWEGSETFDFILSKVKGAGLTGNAKTIQATGTILDDEPTITAAAGSLYEPTVAAGASADDLAANLKTMRFAVSLSAPATNAVSVAYSAVSSKETNGAKVGKDFAAGSGTLTFQPGSVTAYATVEILDDALAEGDEVFDLVLSKPVGGAFTGSAKTITVVGTILDNEPSIDF